MRWVAALATVLLLGVTGCGDDDERGLLPPENSREWTQVTCGEVQDAVANQDFEYLQPAADAVAHDLSPRFPNVNSERLATDAQDTLTSLCDEGASTDDFRPYSPAVARLLRLYVSPRLTPEAP